MKNREVNRIIQAIKDNVISGVANPISELSLISLQDLRLVLETTPAKESWGVYCNMCGKEIKVKMLSHYIYSHPQTYKKLFGGKGYV